MQIIYAQSFGYFTTSVIYYIYRFITWYKKPKEGRTAFFKEVLSAYREEYVEEFDAEEGTDGKQPEMRTYSAFSWHKFSCLASRVISLIIIQFLIFYTFLYCFKASMNGGIISAIFASSLLFTMAFFYLFYG